MPSSVEQVGQLASVMRWRSQVQILPLPLFSTESGQEFMATLAEIDEALATAHAVPVEERGSIWQSFVDRLEAEASLAMSLT